ncbi:MAG: glycoside hydrolase family 127 protein [Clostridia bacterium]|nr:glycoside hydrolase family 127 protein [Clostridia bacterium]
MTAVTIRDAFWDRIRETVRLEGIPYQWKALNDEIENAAPSYCMRNFRIAAGKESGPHGGFMFQDSDVAKWLEGVAYTLEWHPDQELEATADSAIDVIVAAQQPDGYLDTFYIINGLDKRWTNLMDCHELYVAGHMIEAAVAYYQATGKRKLLDAMIRLVEHIRSVFGPEEGKLKGYPGHPVIEMALMRLYEITQDPAHLELARFFIDQRGQEPLYFPLERKKHGNGFYWENGVLEYAYYQAHKPVREQKDAVGHSVRALYLYSGMADVARATDDETLKAACERLFESITQRRMYITGAVGSSEYGEAFTFDYDLPNDTVYAETCASIALVFFAMRMLAMNPDGRYADAMERALYNTVLSGMQLDGKRFFYVNPLEVLPEACAKDQRKRHVKAERQPWFGCACCPPNLIRLVTSLEKYVVTQENETLYVHLYMGGDISAKVGDEPVTLHVQTGYPWEGGVNISLSAEHETAFDLALRIPGWCAQYTLHVNGEAVETQAENGYIHIRRSWKNGDSVQLALDMPARVVRANPRVYENAGKAAVMRGPLVYCLEEQDNGANLHLVRMGADPQFATQWQPELLGGVVTITSCGLRETCDGWDEQTLYACERGIEIRPAELKWIPYYAWANRGANEMRVWIRT